MSTSKLVLFTIAATQVSTVQSRFDTFADATTALGFTATFDKLSASFGSFW